MRAVRERANVGRGRDSQSKNLHTTRTRLRLRIFPRPPWGAPRRVHSSHGRYKLVQHNNMLYMYNMYMLYFACFSLR